ncbi:MAG TPA: hypothetical protein PLY34_08705 [Ferruginibacter sp.]|nr:hypothetical protein [Ferruginibacter sp.]HPH90233.1 hypothetical protein [Ferruginibacter sp.]
MKIVLSIFCMFCVTGVSAQASDFILFKKKGITQKTYFTGSTIVFTANSGAHIEANILAIKNDSLVLRQYITRPVMTPLGVYVLDTSFYYYQYHYKDIAAIGKTGRRFDLASSGGALMGGGLLLTVASGVVYLSDNKRFSPELLGAAVGLMGVGYLLSRNAGKGMVIGKKYSLEYIRASDQKKP